MATNRKTNAAAPPAPDAESAPEEPTAKFEEQLAELEAIVERIDSGELSLEDSIANFERGVALVRSLNRRLDAADHRVEALTRGPDGELLTAPLDDDDENSS